MSTSPTSSRAMAGLGGEGQVGLGVDLEVNVGGVDGVVRSNHHGRSAVDVEGLRVYNV